MLEQSFAGLVLFAPAAITNCLPLFPLDLTRIELLLSGLKFLGAMMLISRVFAFPKFVFKAFLSTRQ